MKKALDPQVKKASQVTVNKIKNDIKKQNQMNKMAGKTEKVYVEKPSEFGGLKELVEMKKQKAIANELDSMIYEQDLSKKQRGQDNLQGQQPQKRTPSPIEIWLAANMDKLKDMSEKEVAKLSMLINPSGGGDMSMLMAIMNMKGNDNNGGGGLSDKLLGLVIEKLFNDKGNDKKSGNGDMEIFKMMMAQNMKTQEMMMGMMMKQNAPPQENKNNTFMKEIFGMIKGQSDLENSMLREKLHELEMRQNQTDPLGEAKRMLDYVKTFGGAFGGGAAATPATMNHELKMKEMQFEQARQVNEEARRSSSMDQIGGMINNTIETFGKILSEPIAEAAKSKLTQFTEQAKHPEQKIERQRMKVSKGQLQEEIELGDLENLEAELAQYEENQEKEMPQKRSRFKVTESGK